MSNREKLPFTSRHGRFDSVGSVVAGCEYASELVKLRAMRRVIPMNAVDRFGGPVGGTIRVEVGQDCSLFGPRRERGHDFADEFPAPFRSGVDIAELLAALPRQGDFVVKIPAVSLASSRAYSFSVRCSAPICRALRIP